MNGGKYFGKINSLYCVCVCVSADLRKCEERGELLLPVLFFLLVVMSVLLYFAVSLMDPGFVLTDTVKVRNPRDKDRADTIILCAAGVRYLLSYF